MINLHFLLAGEKLRKISLLDKNCNVHSNMPPRRDDSHIFFLDRPTHPNFGLRQGLLYLSDQIAQMPHLQLLAKRELLDSANIPFITLIRNPPQINVWPIRYNFLSSNVPMQSKIKKPGQYSSEYLIFMQVKKNCVTYLGAYLQSCLPHVESISLIMHWYDTWTEGGSLICWRGENRLSLSGEPCPTPETRHRQIFSSTWFYI